MVYREHGHWTGLYNLLSVEGETCIVALPNGQPMKFQTTIVKLYYENHKEVEVECLEDHMTPLTINTKP